MANALLTALLSSPQIVSVTTGAGAQDATQIPPELLRLTPGTVIKGFVIKRDAQNNPILRTPQGDVLVQSELFLKTGSEVVVRIEQQAQQLRARIVSVDNVPVKSLLQAQQPLPAADRVMEPSLAPRAGLPAQAMSQTATPTVATTPLTTSVVTLNALLLKPPANPAPAELIASVLRVPLPAAQSIVQGQPLQFRLVAADIKAAPQPLPTAAMPPVPVPVASQTAPVTVTPLPAAISAPQPTLSQPVSNPAPVTAPAPPVTAAPARNVAASPVSPSPQQVAQYQAYGAAPPPSSSPAAPAQPTTVSTPAFSTPSASIGSTAAPVVATPTPAAPMAFNPSRPVISVQVLGNEPGGETIVRSPVGVLKLFTASPPPAGSILQLEWIPSPPAPARVDIPLSVPTSALPPELAAGWQSLQESATLLRTEPLAFADLMQRVPNTKSEFVNHALFLISALKTGDIRQWLSPRSIGRLEERAPALLQRISGDFTTLSRAAAEQPDQPWQMILLPLRHEDEWQPVRLYLRREDKPAAGQDKRRRQRFIIDLTVSGLGDMQLDGLCRGQDRTLMFDLVVRSEAALEQDVQDGISALYQNGADGFGFTGTLRFEAGRRHFQSPHYLPPEDSGSHFIYA